MFRFWIENPETCLFYFYFCKSHQNLTDAVVVNCNHNSLDNFNCYGGLILKLYW